MVRARASTKQDLGSPCRRRRPATGWLLNGHEALPLQALEHRKRRRQWFAALAVMPAPVRDRYLDVDPSEGRHHRLPNKKSLLGRHQRLPCRQRRTGERSGARLSLVVVFISIAACRGWRQTARRLLPLHTPA